MRTSGRVALSGILALLGGGTACDSGTSVGREDRVAAACARLFDASCAKFVDCKVMEGGKQLTGADCVEIRDGALSDCETNQAANLDAATDTEIDDCVHAYETLSCQDEVCGQVPADPVNCRRGGVLNDAGLVPTTSTDAGRPTLLLGTTVTCAQ